MTRGANDGLVKISKYMMDIQNTSTQYPCTHTCTHASAHKGLIMFQFLTCSPRWPEAHFEAWAGLKLMQPSCFEQQEWWNSKGKPNVEVAVRYFD